MDHHNPTYLISTSRLRLRRLRLDDVRLLDTLNHDDGVLQFLARKPPSLEEVTAMVNSIIEDYSRLPQLGLWVAEALTGEFIGWFALRPFEGEERSTFNPVEDPVNVVELGYSLRTYVWGKGLATEGTRKVLEHAFSMSAVKHVVRVTMFTNQRSRRVLERSGLRYVKTFHKHFDDPLPGTELGEVLYSISKKEWEELSSARSA